MTGKSSRNRSLSPRGGRSSSRGNDRASEKMRRSISLTGKSGHKMAVAPRRRRSPSPHASSAARHLNRSLSKRKLGNPENNHKLSHESLQSRNKEAMAISSLIDTGGSAAHSSVHTRGGYQGVPAHVISTGSDSRTRSALTATNHELPRFGASTVPTGASVRSRQQNDSSDVHRDPRMARNIAQLDMQNRGRDDGRVDNANKTFDAKKLTPNIFQQAARGKLGAFDASRSMYSEQVAAQQHGFQVRSSQGDVRGDATPYYWSHTGGQNITDPSQVSAALTLKDMASRVLKTEAPKNGNPPPLFSQDVPNLRVPTSADKPVTLYGVNDIGHKHRSYAGSHQNLPSPPNSAALMHNSFQDNMAQPHNLPRPGPSHPGPLNRGDSNWVASLGAGPANASVRSLHGKSTVPVADYPQASNRLTRFSSGAGPSSTGSQIRRSREDATSAQALMTEEQKAARRRELNAIAAKKSRAKKKAKELQFKENVKNLRESTLSSLRRDVQTNEQISLTSFGMEVAFKGRVATVDEYKKVASSCSLTRLVFVTGDGNVIGYSDKAQHSGSVISLGLPITTGISNRDEVVKFKETMGLAIVRANDTSNVFNDKPLVSSYYRHGFGNVTAFIEVGKSSKCLVLMVAEYL